MLARKLNAASAYWAAMTSPYRFSFSLPKYKCYHYIGTAQSREHRACYLQVPDDMSIDDIQALAIRFMKAGFLRTLDHIARCRHCSGEDLVHSDCVELESFEKIPPLDGQMLLEESVIARLENQTKERLVAEIKDRDEKDRQKRELEAIEEAELESVRTRHKRRRLNKASKAA